MTFVKCLHKTNLLWIFIMGILGSDLSDLIQWWTDFFQILHFASSWQLHVLTWLQALELKMLHITAYSRLYWYLNVMPGSARMEVFGAHYSFWHRSTKRVVQHCDGSLWCTIFFLTQIKFQSNSSTTLCYVEVWCTPCISAAQPLLLQLASCVSALSSSRTACSGSAC